QGRRGCAGRERREGWRRTEGPGRTDERGYSVTGSGQKVWRGPVALGAIQVTDSLLVGIADVPTGIRPDPRLVSARACWYSLGFLLREAAARLLDIQSRELRVGLRVTAEGHEAHGEIFLADDLENGAGYATHIGQPEEFSRLVGETRDFVDFLATPPHAETCEASCYDCLRDYYNMAYHPLLDWKLGRDMLALIEGATIDLSVWAREEEDLSHRFAEDFAGSPMALDSVQGVDLDDRVLLLTHPLEDQRPEYLSPRLANAMAAAEDLGFGDLAGRPIVFAHSFDLLRRPGWVAGRVLG
ncbi:MAG: DUF1998 domain-containing protein, partial [Acidimicrobiia bacterium]